MGEIFKQPAKIRKAAQRGKEITIPPRTSFEPGDDVTQFYDDSFILIVTKGAKVNEELLRQAVMTEGFQIRLPSGNKIRLARFHVDDMNLILPDDMIDGSNDFLKGSGKAATILERLERIIVEQLGVEDKEIVPSASFIDDLGADSLDLVELIMSMEEEFSNPSQKIEIPDNGAEKILTVQDAVDYIKGLGIQDE